MTAIPLPETAEPWIRQLTSSDRRAVAFSIRHLGERSLRQRYLGATSRELTEFDEAEVAVAVSDEAR
jgi:hypothetical protein